MKAERRHELQHNALADWLGGVVEQAKPHAGVIVGVIAAVVLAVVAYAYFSNSAPTRRGPAWDAYFRATDIEGFEQRVKELNRVAEENPGTPVGLWAQLTVGDSRLLEGTNKSFKQRLAGEEELSKAIDHYENVAQAAVKLSPAQGEELHRRALWGLAQTHESLAEPEIAIEEYEDIAKRWPDSAFGKAAAARAKKLSGMQAWFEWYASVDPSTIKRTQRDRQPPLDFTPPRRPQPYDDLPDDPDLTLPGPLDLDPTTTGGGLLQDPPSDDKPAETTPPIEGETSGETALPDGAAATTPADDANDR